MRIEGQPVKRWVPARAPDPLGEIVAAVSRAVSWPSARATDPFAGRWALPGGFVDENERLADAARRELKEETGVDQADLEQLHTFGDPGRDPRGWTVSVAYLALVTPNQLKPVAGDDAAAVGWFPLDKLPPLAFDHADILARVRHRLADRAA